jgi:hypothetical protein
MPWEGVKIRLQPGLLVYTRNSSYSGGRRKFLSSRLALAKLLRPYLKHK